MPAPNPHRMSTRQRVFVWVVIAVAVVIWIAAIWSVETQWAAYWARYVL
jgi:hypothetical protein